MKVTLRTWGPQDNLFPTIFDGLQANWGEVPSNVESEQLCRLTSIPHDLKMWEHLTRWCTLTDGQRTYVESCFAGKTLPQILELITFNFVIDGCTRAATHQIVRTRQAAFMQHGGRDNDWRHRRFTMPETMERMCQVNEQFARAVAEGEITKRGGATSEGRRLAKQQVKDGIERANFKHCITTWGPFDRLDERLDLGDESSTPTLREQIEFVVGQAKTLYAALVDAGIPWQDARRVLPIGLQTYIHEVYDWPTLKATLGNRLEHVMDWEHNCIAQLMLREIHMKCPPIFAKNLGSQSDFAGAAKFAGLESWPPDGKWPNPNEVCAYCHKSSTNHDRDQAEELRQEYSSSIHEYVPMDTLPRTHRPEQNPFWILHPDSMKGGDIVWIPTNGTWPEDVPRERKG